MDTETQINKDVLISSVWPMILWKGLSWMTLSHIQRLENRQRTSRVKLNYNTHQPPRLNEENTKSCRDIMQQTWCWFSHQKWIFLRTTGDISKYFICVKTRCSFLGRPSDISGCFCVDQNRLLFTGSRTVSICIIAGDQNRYFQPNQVFLHKPN